MHLLIINPNILFPLSSSQFLLLLNEHAIIYIEEIETSLLTLFGPVSGFMEGKGR
jgi:hypothetical protein